MKVTATLTPAVNEKFLLLTPNVATFAAVEAAVEQVALYTLLFSLFWLVVFFAVLTPVLSRNRKQIVSKS